MLVLSRRESEEIRIGRDITVMVTRIRGGQVRIGITAPREVEIRRAELRGGNADGTEGNGAD
jgi:carbon storage regulator